tara:strand:- start:32 stop:1468 length:1437 start_codon:yes stop_codon:yes gene_type:complete
MRELITPVILCGGSGTRLWPLSRDSFPKQYLSINSKKNKTLLQKTYERIKNLDNFKESIFICNEEHRFIVAEQLREIKAKNYSILLEPSGRNTTPAIAIAALKVISKSKDSILLILSADHEIKKIKKFLDVIKYGCKYALDDKLVTFGVIPTYPEIGYGYIKSEKPFKNNEYFGSKILEFKEKPNLKNAEEYLKDKRFTWNSGMFLFKASAIIDEINKFEPEIILFAKEAIKNSQKDMYFERLNKFDFNKCKNISIDLSVMEKTSKGIVLPLDAGWSDIGSWKSVWDLSEKDGFNNVKEGKVLLEDSSNCYLRSDKRIIVGIGIKDLVVVETNDAILISDIHQTQKVKNIVQKLKENNLEEGQKHSQIFRPWGYYLSIAADKKWQVKLIQVKPGEQLSLQKHQYRSEHWVVVKGKAKVEIDERSETLDVNQSIYIPTGSKHRLSNPSKEKLILIEVQSGEKISEEDIQRFEDKYGRIE